MNDAAYYDDAAKLIMTRVRGILGEDYSYYDGDPILIPEANLPAVVVEPLTMQINASATMTDDFFETILIKVILNKKTDYGADGQTDMTKKKLRRLIAGRDPETGYYTTNSLVGSLRTQITLGDYALQNDMEVQFDVDVRPEDVITSEAYITCTLRTRVIVPNRS